MNKNTKTSQSQQALPPVGQPLVQGIHEQNILIPKGFSNEKKSHRKNLGFNLKEAIKEAKLNINNRLDELANLSQGWYDGEQGEVIPSDSIIKFKKNFLESTTIFYLGNKAYIYPTIEGGLSIEWDFFNTNISHATLDVDMKTFKATFSYYSEDDELDDEKNVEYNLKLKKDWLLLQQLFFEQTIQPKKKESRNRL